MNWSAGATAECSIPKKNFLTNDRLRVRLDLRQRFDWVFNGFSLYNCIMVPYQQLLFRGRSHMSKMQIGWNLASTFGALAIIGLISTGSAAQTIPPGIHQDPLENPATAVLTYHNDNARTGQFTLETALT